jgi:hypothetical protein
MATKVCPECGAEYIASATRCADCDVELVAGGDAEEVTTDAELTGEQIAYELSEWSPESRTLLDQLLVGDSIPHVWESGTLVIDQAHETKTDQLVDQVEVSQQPTLDPDAERIAYPLEGWSEDKRATLGEALTDDGIAHGWDSEDNLVVSEDDQDHVDAVIDRIDAADELDVDPEADEGDEEDQGGAGGADAETVMSDLFVSADRLMHKPKDRSDREVLAKAATAASTLPLPYGLPRPIWDDLVARANELVELLDADPIDEDAAIDAAKAVREHLRDYV